MGLPFQIASKVRCRNQIWEVGKIDDNEDGTWTIRLYPVNGGKPQSFLYPHSPIEPVGSALDHLEEGRIDHIDHYRLLTSATRLSLVYEYDKLLSISNSKMIPEQYQLLAVKKVMESLRQRFLIADDVGLGKTIEAGLIMQELAARQRGSRVLIVVPASLQDQWKKEMQRHFLRIFYIYNSRKMEGIQELVDENLNPWLAKNSIITSIDWVKPQYKGSGTSSRNINKVFDQLINIEKRWDLVIIDEAQYASTDSNRADLAKALQDRCDSLLLLSATPHSGNPEHFFNLLNLIDPFMFADPDNLNRPDARERVNKVMIRRGKETIFELNEKGELVKKFRDRDPHAIEIEFTKAEKQVYDAVSEYTASGWAQLSRKRKISATERNIGKFLLTLVQKRMVSSLSALRETLHRRIDSIVESRTISRIEGREEAELKRLLKDYNRNYFMEDEDRELVERYLETRRIQAIYAERTNEVKILRDLLGIVDELIKTEQDSKLSWLISFLKQLFAKDPNEKVIIFTEYRDTLNYLRTQLEKKWFLGKESIRKTQFLSGCRQFTREDIHSAENAIEDSQKAIPTHKDVQAFVETFLRVYGDPGRGEQDGRRLHQTSHKGVYRVLAPSVIQDEKFPKILSRVTFDRSIATKDWQRSLEPEFLAFGHPILERMVHYCRVTRSAELGGKLAWLVADYAGLPGVTFNFLMRFEDRVGRVIREELEPVFVDQEGKVQPELGRKLFLGPNTPQVRPVLETLSAVRERIADLQHAAESHIRTKYQEYYQGVEEKRNQDIVILMDDLARFDKGAIEHLQARLRVLTGDQLSLFDDPASKGQRTRIENQIKVHQHRMQERRLEVENMRLGAFPAPELLNMVVVTPG